MAGLAYSAHLSQKNSAINSKAKLSGVAKAVYKRQATDSRRENGHCCISRSWKEQTVLSKIKGKR